MKRIWIGAAALGLAATASVAAAQSAPGPTAPADIRAGLLASMDLGDFETVAQARAAWNARAGGRAARATAGDWEIAFTAAGILYVLGSVGEVDSGEGMRPPQ